MGGGQTEKEKVDKRHVAGFRKFQNAAIKALAAVMRLIDGGPEDEKAAGRAVVKLSDMKSLVSTYKEAVVGEKMISGSEAEYKTHNNTEEDVEYCVRWVIDEDAGPGGAGAEDD